MMTVAKPRTVSIVLPETTGILIVRLASIARYFFFFFLEKKAFYT